MIVQQKRTLTNIPHEEKLTRCTISTTIEITFAPQCNDISDGLIKTWFKYYGSIVQIHSRHNVQLERLVSQIKFEQYDSVDKIKSSLPLDALFVENVQK
ncbi:unnamed protein product, partial [Didymodactylos carnosus]